ncbi:MAG: hypothetical protein P1U41_08760 [Vicingaceae bacterium]|nr:hypothetical protein [Vicingaceae bacterium]
MKRISFSIITLMLYSLSTFAQKTKKVDDLTFLFVDEKYDKVVYKGEALMQDADYRKHPLVYIYTSMSYYEMSKLPGKYSVDEKDSEFPKTLKMAQKHLYKFVKTDQKAPKYYDNSWFNDFKEYYVHIADTSNSLAQYLYMNDKFRKAASVYKYAYRAVPSDPVLLLWQSISEVKSQNAVEGKKNMILALKQIDENYKPSKATSGVLAHGMLLAEEYLRTTEYTKEAAKAKKLVAVFKKYDPDELDKKKMEARKTEAKKDDRVMRKFFSNEEDEDNKDVKGEVIIKDGYGSGGNGTKTNDQKLDELEKKETGGQ